MSVIVADGGMPVLELHSVHFTPQGHAPGADADTRTATGPERDRAESAEVFQVAAEFTGRLTFLARGQPHEDLLIAQIRPLLEKGGISAVYKAQHNVSSAEPTKLSAHEQFAVEAPDDSEPPSMLMSNEPARPGPERMATGQIRSITRQNSIGKKFRIDNVGGMSPEMGEPARGQLSWWMHSQQGQQGPQGPVLGAKIAADQQVSRDLFGTCHFTQERTDDGRRRRLVKKATIGDGQEAQEEDFDDTASWQSWRSGVVSSASRRSSRGRSTSVMSVVSNASAVAMRELLAGSDDEAHPYDADDDYAFGPPAARTLSGRSNGPIGIPVMHRLSIPGANDHPPKRPMLASPPPTAREPREEQRNEQRDRDWGTCVFGKDQAPAPGQRGRRLVKPMIQQLAVPGAGGEDEETARSNSWMSFAGEVGRSLSQASMASMASETGPGVVQTPSGVGMQELLADNSFSPERPLRSGRRGTAQMLQDLYAAAE